MKVQYILGKKPWTRDDDYFENDFRSEIEERFAYRAPTMQEPSKLKFGSGRDGSDSSMSGRCLIIDE